MIKDPKCLCIVLLPMILLSSCWFSRNEEPLETPTFNPAEAALKLQKDPIMEPGGVEKHMSMGNKYYLMDRLDDAIKEYERALELNPNHIE
ncbi:MAG: tetratricopeptide repeat protein, partial [Candidatus Brocadiales bacterium]|nr:tetratricopeptide repeat protein [Candidatus Bathyanammoxibius sp.]